jgi:hypothetical protein
MRGLNSGFRILYSPENCAPDQNCRFGDFTFCPAPLHNRLEAHINPMQGVYLRFSRTVQLFDVDPDGAKKRITCGWVLPEE